MLLRETPTFSLSGTRTAYFSSSCLILIATLAGELLVERVWYRSQARIHSIRSGGAPPETSATRTPGVTRLPLELVKEIIDCLSNDVRSLRTCSVTH